METTKFWLHQSAFSKVDVAEYMGTVAFRMLIYGLAMESRLGKVELILGNG